MNPGSSDSRACALESLLWESEATASNEQWERTEQGKARGVAGRTVSAGGGARLKVSAPQHRPVTDGSAGMSPGAARFSIFKEKLTIWILYEISQLLSVGNRFKH